MREFDRNAIKYMLNMLVERLERELSGIEKEAFSIQRSGIAYEMMIDSIKNESKEVIEAYVTSVVNEYKVNYKIN